MSTDPVRLLIEAGAIASDPFAPNSRYRGVAQAAFTRRPGEPVLRYLLRRFAPQRRAIGGTFEHIVQGGERPDLLAANTLGDPELYWRIADANAVIDPNELTDTVGARVIIPPPSNT